MSEIEITLPTVQYGNVKVRATPEELGVNDISDSYELGVAAAVYLNLFQQGFKHGATLDVTAPQGAAQNDRVSQAIAEVVADEKAIRALADGLGGATEVDEYDSATEAKEQWQDADYAPWDQKVAAQPKPWETETATW